ncbi:MAG: hypothetical protein WCI62_03895 [Erysipelotrichaceae bacterium]
MKVQRFQVYHQKENTVTSNVIQLFKWIQSMGNEGFNEFLGLLFNEEDYHLVSDVQFNLQVKNNTGTPDAIISQPSFKIVIETKVNAKADVDQLMRHCSHFGSEDAKVLLLVDTVIDKKLKPKVIEEIKKQNGNSKSDIKFHYVTFSDIVNALSNVNRNASNSLDELIDEFTVYCERENLLVKTKMLIVPVGDTIDINERNGVYYCPTERTVHQSPFMGLYANYAVNWIGKIVGSADIETNENKELVASNVIGVLGKEELVRVKQCIKESFQDLGWQVGNGYRFYVVDQFIESKFKKNGARLRKARLLDIAKYPYECTETMSTKDVTVILKEFDWE